MGALIIFTMLPLRRCHRDGRRPSQSYPLEYITKEPRKFSPGLKMKRKYGKNKRILLLSLFEYLPAIILNKPMHLCVFIQLRLKRCPFF